MSKNVLYVVVAVVLAGSMVMEFMGVHMHAPHWWPLHFGYNVFFGFAGCWALIIMSKMIMAAILQRSEDYYDEDGGEDDD